MNNVRKLCQEMYLEYKSLLPVFVESESVSSYYQGSNCLRVFTLTSEQRKDELLESYLRCFQ